MTEAAVRVEVLGRLQLRIDVRTLQVRSDRQRTLLALLALAAPRPVPTARLVQALWPGAPPRSAVHALHVHVSSIRKRVRAAGGPDPIVTRGDTYGLDPAVVLVDAHDVEARVGEARAALVAGDPSAALRIVSAALAVWRGEPYPELADDVDAAAERSRLEELRRGLTDERAEAKLALGEHVEVVAELEQVLRTEPLRERPYRQLMVALYRSGRQVEALEVYQRARAVLREHIGVEPGPMLRETEHAILHHDPALLGSGRAAIPSSSPDPHTFVGREADLAELGVPLRHGDGGGSIVLLVGDPGVGKTRLATELAVATGRTVLTGACPEGGGAPPLWPIAEALRPLGSLAVELVAGQIDPVALAPLVAAVAGRPPTSVEAAEVDTFRLREAAAALLSEVATRALLVLDDLQWADVTTLGALVHLARRLPTTALTVIATLRHAPHDLDGPLGDALATLTRSPRVVRRVVQPLTATDVGAYVRAVGVEAPPAVLDSLMARCEGNALVLTELVRLLQDTRTLDVDQLPVGLAQVLDRRLDAVPEAARVLAVAAVIGRSFPLDVLARTAEVGADELIQALDQAHRCGLVTRTEHEAHFSHVLLAERAAARLPDLERRRVHLRAAEAWQQRVNRPTVRQVTEEARHRVAALPLGNPGTAADACVRAGAEAFAANAYEDAASMFATARAACGFGEDVEAVLIDALVGEGECRMLLGQTDAARPLLLDAVDLARRLDDPERFALAVRVLATARATSAGGSDHVVTLLDEAAARLEGVDSWLRVQLLCDRGLVRYRTPERDAGVAIAEEALAVARRIGDPKAISFALTGLHGTILTPDTVDRRRCLAAEAVRTAAEAGVEWQEAMALSFRAMAAWETGDTATAATDLDRAAVLADRSGRIRFRWIAQSWLALLCLLRGDHEGAEAGFTAALALWGPHPNPDAFLCFSAQQLNLALVRGTAGELVELIRTASNDDPHPRTWQGLLTLPLVQAGRAAEARAALDALVADGVELVPRDVTWPVVMAMIAESAAAVGHLDAARAALAQLEPFADRHVVLNVYGGGGFCWGSLAHQVGLLYGVTGNHEQARTALERAVAEHERVRAPWFAARSREALARLRARR